MSDRPVCVIEVGHRRPVDRLAVWVDALHPSLTVCDRHRYQYDERDDLGPFDWREL